jgi:hypothetical protein
VAHGRWYDRAGPRELRRVFRWLGVTQAWISLARSQLI